MADINYQFLVKTETGTTVASGMIQNINAGRDRKLQAQAGGSLKETTDHGGHLIAASENEPAIPENLFAQDAHLNQGSYKSIENAERRLVSENMGIQTEKIAFISGQKLETGMRPDAFMVNDTVTYVDGKTQCLHFSFANMTVEEQEDLNHFIDNCVCIPDILNLGDALRDSMLPSEYAGLMEETDTSLPAIRDEFDGQVSVSTPMEQDMESDAWDSGVSNEEGTDIGSIGDGADISLDIG